MARAAGEEDRCLSRPSWRAPTTMTYLAAAQLSLELRGAVVDTHSLELGEVGKSEATVLDAAGDDDRARLDHLPVGEPDLEAPVVALASEPRGAPRDRDRGAEFLRLRQCPRAASAWPEIPVGKPR